MTIENTEQVKTTEQSEGWDFDHALTVSKTNIEVAWALEVAENLGTIPKNKNTEDAIVALKKGEMPELSHLQSHYNALQRKLNSISNEKEQKAAEYKKRTFRAVEPGVEIPVHRIEGKGKKVVISPGSFTGPEHVGEYAIATALHGNDVTVPELLLSEHGDPTAKTTQLMNAYSRSIEVGMKAAQLKEGEKATLVGFSSGAVAVAEYASRSDDVDHVILDAPLGLVLNKSPYLMRMYSTVKGSLEHAKMLKETGLLSDPRYARFADWVPRQRERGFSELAELLHASAKVNLMPILDDLIRQGKKVTIIAMEDDKLYTIEEIEKSVAKSETGGVKVLVLKGGHTKIGEDPEGLAAFTNDAIQGEMK